MYLLSLMILLAGLFIFVSHRKRWLYAYLFYTAFLYFVLAGFEGFANLDPADINSKAIFMVLNTIVFLLHIPLIIRLSQYRPKEHRVKMARKIFDKDVFHLHDEKLHKHLGHH